VEVHSHPFCGHGAAFSSIDVRNELAKFPYVAERIPDIHHATLVFGTESVDGHYWDRRAQRIVPVDRLRVIDAPLQVLTTTSGGRRCTATAWQRFLGWCGRRALAEAPDDLPASVQRQVLAFGAEGQRRIGETTIGVVGLGGLGSLTVQMLAHLGCGELVLVDDDRVEETNLNRLVGAEPADAACKLPKVMAAARMARRINPRTKVTLADARLQNPEATDALRRCDAVFGALDNHGARLLLNEFCCRYLLPYIDMGTGLRVTPDAPLQAGGQVRLVLPGGFCLECIGGIDRQRAAYDLMSLEGQERQRVRGYVEGADVPAPAVIFLNTTIAAIAVQECVNLLCGFKPAHRLIHWDATACLARPLDGGLRREDCVVCGQGQLLALGDLSRLEPATPAPLPEALVAVATPA
jgi:molybdopterin/thiamine biosynthesis adenylyltransferase